MTDNVPKDVPRLTLIGFGEAGRTFATAAGWREMAQVYDIKTDQARHGS